MFALLVYAGVRHIPPRPARLPPPEPVEVPAVVVPVTFHTPQPIDLNSASRDELQELPGIGPTLAERIVSYRRQHGPFEQVEDLLQVAGIGEATLAGLRDQVTVNPP